mmetsp:Transcript_91569/g.262290  ORF Transcript_91569/g.262290 Transcript_91569/m.262290 type:complete len:169 (-) Transcript_91569:128-634(-)
MAPMVAAKAQTERRQRHGMAMPVMCLAISLAAVSTLHLCFSVGRLSGAAPPSAPMAATGLSSSVTPGGSTLAGAFADGLLEPETREVEVAMFNQKGNRASRKPRELLSFKVAQAFKRRGTIARMMSEKGRNMLKRSMEKGTWVSKLGPGDYKNYKMQDVIWSMGQPGR